MRNSRGAWQRSLAVHGVARVGHDRATNTSPLILPQHFNTTLPRTYHGMRVPGPGRVWFCLPQKLTHENPAKERNLRAGTALGIPENGATLAGKGAAEKVPADSLAQPHPFLHPTSCSRTSRPHSSP